MGTQQHIVPICSDTDNQAGSGYFGFPGERQLTEAPSQMPFSKGRIVALNINLPTMTATSVTITLRKNGADTAITNTFTTPGQKTITGIVDIVDGDLLNLYVVKSGAGATAWRITNAEVKYGNA